MITSTTGADIRFDARVDGTPGGAPEKLTINGGLIANGAIGSVDPLGGLSVSGLARLNGGEVATRDGGQSYAGGILLGAALIFVAGFAPQDAVHNAAHDTRHSTGFPCH